MTGDTIVIQESPTTVTVDEDAVTVSTGDQAVSVVTVGTQGPAGPSGTSQTYTQSFDMLSTVVVNHDLGKYPSVTVMDTADDVVMGEVVYDSLYQLTLSFSAAFSGTVICN